MSAAANTVECIEQLVGESLVGIVEEWSDSEITRTKALVFSSGRALVLGDNGSYWVASAEDVQFTVSRLADVVTRTAKTAERILQLAGVGASRPTGDPDL